MPNVTINSIAYTGTVVDAANNSTSVHIAPFDVSNKPKSYGMLFEAPNGVQTVLQRSVKEVFTLLWHGTPEYTRAAVQAVARLGTSFAYIDVDGTSYTVVCFDGDYDQKLAWTKPTPGGLIRFWDVTLVLRST